MISLTVRVGIHYIGQHICGSHTGDCVHSCKTSVGALLHISLTCGVDKRVSVRMLKHTQTKPDIGKPYTYSGSC